MKLVLLATHSWLYLETLRANPSHINMGIAGIYGMTKLTMEYLHNHQLKLKRLYMGEASRYEDIFDEFIRQSGYECPAIITEEIQPNMIIGTSWYLGGPSYRRSRRGNQLFTNRCRALERKNCKLLSDCVSIAQAWDYVRKEEELLEDGECEVFCSGRQQLRSLGKEKDFELTSVYRLDWRQRHVECIIKKGVLV